MHDYLKDMNPKATSHAYRKEKKKYIKSMKPDQVKKVLYLKPL